MEWINYHHLHYFWLVFKEGSVSKAAQKLRLSQPTVSSQIAAFEAKLGEKLFERQGRGLALTEAGKMAFRYAEEIFSLGGEMLDTIRGRPSGKPLRFLVGVADAVPKMIAHRLLMPAFRLSVPLRIVCHEDKSERLLARLSVHGLDMVLSDTPIPPFVKVKAYNHLLADYGVSVMGTEALARKYRKGFPQSLDGAPFLLPAAGASLRQSLDQWFDSKGLRPLVAGEFDDSALMKVFAEAGAGLCALPDILERRVAEKYGLRLAGRIPQLRERFYALSVERKLKHPAVLAIADSARRRDLQE